MFIEILLKGFFYIGMVTVLLLPFISLSPEDSKDYTDVVPRKKLNQSKLIKKNERKPSKIKHDYFLDYNNIDESHFRYYGTRKRNDVQKTDPSSWLD